jgi:hypothetical protein
LKIQPWKGETMAILRGLFWVFLFGICFVPSAWSSSSVNVPLDSRVYAALEKLEGYGLIDSALAGTKPYSRLEAARLVGEAMNRWREVADQGKFSKFARYEIIPFLLQELEREFKGELIERGDLIGTQPGTYWKFVDAINLRYQYQSHNPVVRPQGGNPPTHTVYPIYNNDGIVYKKYNNFTADLEGEIRLWDHLSLFYRPIVKAFENENTQVDLRQGYGKLEAWNLELEVGRDQLWWGPGSNGSLLMTNNARSFDLVKLSNSYPYTIPILGALKFNLFASRLDNDAPSIKDPTLFAMRFDLKPHPIIELGASFLAIFDGEGRKAMDFNDYLKAIFGNTEQEPGSKTANNRQISLDLSIRWPNMDRVLPVAKSAKVYGEVGAEDYGFLPDRRAYVVGLGLYDLFLLGRMDFKVEYANTSPSSNPTAWYTHTDYPPLFHDRIFGHHVGSNADDIFTRLSFSILKNLVLGMDFERETQGKQEAQTTRSYRAGVDLDICINRWVSVFARYIYERFEDPDLIAGGTGDHHLGGVELRIKF